MKITARFILLTFLVHFVRLSPALAGHWIRVDSQTLRFEGKIVEDDVKGLDAVLQTGDKVLYVDSRGGDAEAGVQIALRLVPKKMTVIVDGFCASSCANYIFTSGDKKEIRKGWVGYHGNMTALLAKDWDKNAKELKERSGLTDQQIEELHDRLMKSAEMEKAYFASIGVSQDLFDRTQSADKGMGNGAEHAFLCPSPQTFEKYGIQNVSGSQDMTYFEELGLNNVFD